MTVWESMRALLDLLFPRTCVVCGKVLSQTEKSICGHCLDDVPYTYYWSREHNPMADRLNDRIQLFVEKDLEAGILPDVPEMYARAMSLFFYKSSTGYREITKALKYHSDFRTGRLFASMLAVRIRETAYLSDVDLIVPVPLHWTRRWSRGYNQAEIIADTLSSELGIPCRRDLLRRVRRTATQTKLDVEHKGANVSGAFRMEGRPSVIPGHILLVDDVFTTGATLAECHRALRSVLGPEVRISVATLACVGS